MYIWLHIITDNHILWCMYFVPWRVFVLKPNPNPNLHAKHGDVRSQRQDLCLADTSVWWWCAKCNYAVLAAYFLGPFGWCEPNDFAAEDSSFELESNERMWNCWNLMALLLHPPDIALLKGEHSILECSEAASTTMAASNFPGTSLHSVGQYQGH